MSAVPAARFLADFSAGGDFAPPVAGAVKADQNSAGAAAKLEEAYGRGLLNGRAAVQAQFNIKLEEQRKEFAAELAAEREKWAAETGEHLANCLQAAVQEFEGRVAETTARILKPFLEAEVRRQAVAELQVNLGVLVSSDPGVTLQISGPADVLEALRAQLADKIPGATYSPSDDCEVKIVAGQATLETRLKSWMEKLEEATR